MTFWPIANYEEDERHMIEIEINIYLIALDLMLDACAVIIFLLFKAQYFFLWQLQRRLL